MVKCKIEVGKLKDLHKEFVNRKIKKPNVVLGKIVCFVFKQLSKKRNVEFIYDDDFLEINKGQMILLCQHRSHDDYFYVFGGLKRCDVNILVGYQNIFQKYIYTLLKHLGVIAKMLYQPDVQATVQMMRAVKQGNTIIIFPEGIQSTSGSTHPINPATMKFIAKTKLPVGLLTLKGSYFTKPRYTTDIKKGKIEARFTCAIKKEDYDNYSTDELYAKLLEKFKYNEFEEHENNKVAFIGKKPNIDGLDNIIFKCPHCMSEYKFTVENDKMRCEECGFTISMDEYYDIHPVEKELPFKNIDEWYKWQRRTLSEEIKSDDFVMSTQIKIGKVNTQKLGPNYSLEYKGEGTLSMNNKGLTYKGSYFGQEVTLEFDANFVYSLTMSLQYDLDLYYKGEYFNFKLLENEKQVAKWMVAAEEIHLLYDKDWKRVSKEVY